MGTVSARSFFNIYGAVGSVDDVKQETEIVRNTTQSRMDEMRREIALLIAEYDAEAEKNNINSSVSDKDFEPLANSIRMIKLKNI